MTNKNCVRILQRHSQNGELEVLGLKWWFLLLLFLNHRSKTSEAEEIILAQGINTCSYIWHTVIAASSLAH